MIIGRTEELRTLRELKTSDLSQFVAVYGRRRVGKTFLVREAFDYKFTFQHAGIARQGMKVQLSRFRSSLIENGHKDCPVISNWFDAFDQLKVLVNMSRARKKVVFLDEVAWMDTPKSGFVSALENFWNSWATNRKDIILVICASATSWIIKKVFKSRGGLHNRATIRIPVAPFTLKECEEYAKHLSLSLSRYQIVNLYMVMGGVAMYWSLLDKRLSAVQNIDALFFGPNAKLSGEFEQLYDSLFKFPEPYKKIITSLSTNGEGLTRKDLVSKVGEPDNGDFTIRLEELEQCGFIMKSSAFPKKKSEYRYRLIDNYTLFYFKYLREHQYESDFWKKASNSSSINSWCGLAFERVCLQHTSQIKSALGIGAVLTTEHTWKSDPKKRSAGETGAQIDLLIDRNDKTISVCEIKWSQDEFAIDKETDASIRHKITQFRCETKTRKAIQAVLITPFGLKHNIYYDTVQNVVSADQLFEL